MRHLTREDVEALRVELEILGKEDERTRAALQLQDEVKEAVGKLADLGVDTSKLELPRGMTKKERNAAYKALEKREKQVFDLLLRSDQKHVALNWEITFQCKMEETKYDDNHELGDAVRERFPQILEDSEYDQGWLYLHRDFVKKVEAFLKPHVDEISVRKNDDPIFLWKNVK